MPRKRPQPLSQRCADAIMVERQMLEEQAIAHRKEMEQKNIELRQLFKEMKESELRILKQQEEIRSLCAKIDKLEMDSSKDAQEELQYSHLKAWVQKIFDGVTAGPYQRTFSKFNDPIKQMEMVRDFFRLARAQHSDKAESNPQQD